MRSTKYFDEQVLRKRPYLTTAMCEAVLAAPIRRDVQPDGRIRYFGLTGETPDGKPRILRVVTLDDGVTVHNAFFDRDFGKEAS